MTAPLVVLIPAAVLAIIALACFVGCSLDTSGTKNVVDYSQYENAVTSTNGLVAYWPLNDTSGTKAVDLGPNHFDGTYTVGPTGGFTLNQQNLVPGDTVDNNQTTPSPSVNFDGGYVNIPWHAALGPPKFTLEAWVIPNWALSDPPNTRSVVSFAAAGNLGFALYASSDNHWTATVGSVSAATAHNQTIVQGSLYFLVMTFDGTTLNLWVNPADTTQPADGTNTTSGYTPVSSPVPLYIAMARPDLPTTPMDPFNGWIQDVALFNVALDNTTIESHFLNGSGMQDP